MAGYCRHCKMKFDGSRCPICHGKKSIPLRPIGIGVGIISTIMVGVFVYSTGLVSINLGQIDETIQNTPNEIPTVDELQKPLSEMASSSSEKIDQINKEIQTLNKETTQEQILNKEPPAIVEPPEPTQKQITRDDLYDYALELVNKDREQNGLPPVKLSNNLAAQIHAEDVLKMRTISHWMTNGEKPYMTYTRYNGEGNVGQNVAFGGYSEIEQCQRWNVICESIDPKKAISDSEYGMMYDDAASNWGHRDNIINPLHTHVSFGFAYDEYSYAFVQNFEDNYIDLAQPIGNDPSNVRIVGNVMEGQIQNVSIYYDQYPTVDLYEIHKNDGFYEVGDLTAIVVPPLSPGGYYQDPTGYDLIIAKTMSQSGNSINIEFDMSSVATIHGVYTITVWLKNNDEDIPATSYSMFVE